MSLEEAIRVIQIHERARQGRLRAKFMREIRQQEEREKKAALRGAPTLDPEVASIRIQKVRRVHKYAQLNFRGMSRVAIHPRKCCAPSTPS